MDKILKERELFLSRFNGGNAKDFLCCYFMLHPGRSLEIQRISGHSVSISIYGYVRPFEHDVPSQWNSHVIEFVLSQNDLEEIKMYSSIVYDEIQRSIDEFHEEEA